MKKFLTVSTVVVALFACSGIAAATDYRISWSNNIAASDSQCTSLKTQAYFGTTKVAEVTSTQTLKTMPQTMLISALTCTSIKLSASCSYPSPSIDPNHVNRAYINPTLTINCTNGSAIVTTDRNTMANPRIEFMAR